MLIGVIFSWRIFIVVVKFGVFEKLFLIDTVEWFLHPHFHNKKPDQGYAYNVKINLYVIREKLSKLLITALNKRI